MMTARFGAWVLLAASAVAFIGPMSGCITINIYFPAAAAEKAADRIIDDVLKDGKSGAAAAPASAQEAK